MDASESLNNKILEEKQIEKFSQFIEKYGENVSALKKKLKGHESVPVSTATDVPESVSLFNLTGFNKLFTNNKKKVKDDCFHFRQ